MVIGDHLAEVLRQAPGTRREIPHHRMIGIEQAVFRVDDALFAGRAGVGFFENAHVAGEALDHQGNAAIVEQPQGVGLVRRLVADALGQVKAGHGHILGAVPEAVEHHNGFIGQFTLDRLGIDQVDHRITTQQIDCLLDRCNAIGQAELR